MITGEFRHPNDPNFVDPFRELDKASPEIIDEIHYSLEDYPLAQALIDVVRRFTDPVSWKYNVFASYIRFFNEQFPTISDYEQAVQVQGQARREDTTATVQVEIVVPKSTRRFPSHLFRHSAMGIYVPQTALGPKNFLVRAEDAPGRSSNLAIEQPEQIVVYSGYDAHAKDDLWLGQIKQSLANVAIQLSSDRLHQQEVAQVREALVRNRS